MVARKSNAQALARYWIYFLLVLALSANFIANDRPLIVSHAGELSFPVARELLVDIGLAKPAAVDRKNWYTATTDWACWPPIPYNGVLTDAKNRGFLGPFSKQNTGKRARHYLGTDALGRDVLAGLIYGSRIAVLVGFFAVLISLLIGIPLGGVAGFFGNSGIASSRSTLLALPLAVVTGFVYSYLALAPFWRIEPFFFQLLLALSISAALFFLIRVLLRLSPWMRRKVAAPADTIILQLLELFVNIPGAVFLITVVSFVESPSIWVIILVIGLLGWPQVARHLRAELLRIRSLPYIKSAFGSGLSPLRILFIHALPNALPPLIVVASFMVGSAILLEAFLSFLGIGVATDTATWGALLRRSREQPTAWWLAVFPGLFLTLTILAVQVLGSAYRGRRTGLDGKQA